VSHSREINLRDHWNYPRSTTDFRSGWLFSTFLKALCRITLVVIIIVVIIIVAIIIVVIIIVVILQSCVQFVVLVCAHAADAVKAAVKPACPASGGARGAVTRSTARGETPR
jgi:type IV secretory pathway component VirB8